MEPSSLSQKIIDNRFLIVEVAIELSFFLNEFYELMVVHLLAKVSIVLLEHSHGKGKGEKGYEILGLEKGLKSGTLGGFL